MSMVIVRAGGNIGPFDEIEPWPHDVPDRLRCTRGDRTEDYPFSVIGEYTISEDAEDAPPPSPAPPAAYDNVAAAAANAASRPVAIQGKVRSLAKQGRIAEALKLLSTI